MRTLIESGSALHLAGQDSTSRYRVRRLTISDSIAAELSEWDPAAFGLGAMTPMQSRAWIVACAETLSHDGGLNVILIEDEAGIAALAPLRRDPAFSRTNELLGVAQLGEPSDLIYRDERALAVLIEVMVSDRTPLMLQRLPSSSVSVAAIRSGFRDSGVVIARPQDDCPYIALQTVGKAPDQLLSSSLRSDLRRAERKAQALGKLKYEIHAPRTSAEFNALYEQVLKVEAAGWKGRSGSAVAKNEQQRAFFSRYGILASQAGVLRLACLSVGGVLAAMQYAVEWNGAFWLFKVGYDETFAPCSPGQLLMHHTLRYAIERGLRSYEFLGSAQSWTQRWAKAVRSTVRIAVFPFNARGMFTLGRELVRFVRRDVGERLEARRSAPATNSGRASVAGGRPPA